MLGLIRAAAHSLIIGRRAIRMLRLMIVEQGSAYIKLLWCSQTIIKPDG
jgi:hypothetical protein